MKSYILSNGVKIPAIGFGTYKAAENNSTAVIRDAISVGYRYFDTASIYKNEEQVGIAIKESGIKRDEFFIATKVWKDEMGYIETKKAFDRSLNRLQTDYVDLYMIHWPKPTPDYKDWKQLDIDTWIALEELYVTGKVKAIGLSNFLPYHIDNILEHCTIRPMTNQLEIHPGYTQQTAVSYCKEHNIVLQAWSPLGRQRVLNHPLIIELAEKYSVSVARVCLRFLLELDVIPLPKASTIDRMRENLDIFSFSLDKEDILRLLCLPQSGWSGEHPDFDRVMI